MRPHFPVFVYSGFQYEFGVSETVVCFRFCALDEKGEEAYVFTPELHIPARKFYHPEKLSRAVWESLVFHCGMVELVSYWKAFCSPLVRVECGSLDAEQKAWFKKLYYKGLGEFFYKNNLQPDPETFMEIECTGRSFEPVCPTASMFGEEILVPVGGGKDSVVTLEILRDRFPNVVHPFVVNPRGATRNCCLQAGFKEEECAVVNRNIHPLLLELNKQGFLNGHTPFSAMLAFTSLLVSALSGFRHIALSNENSANESTVADSYINHQYSKSLEFENDFRRYVRKYIGGEETFNYFSFLRPLNEIGIARLFASYPRYHDVFRSCNAGSKTDSWCGACPKCLFAFIILSPFVGIAECSRIFGKNLLNDLSLKPFLNELCGVSAVKPFECVGTRSEVNWALQQLRGCASGNCLLEYYFTLAESCRKEPEGVLEEFAPDNNLPEAFARALRKRVGEVRAENRLKPLLQTEKPIAILGLGREGLSSYRLIRRMFPDKELVLADADIHIAEKADFCNDTRLKFILGKDYLENLSETSSRYGIIMKTPGISLKDFPELSRAENLRSQTDIFLQAYARQIIGVTGTKGKSTTASLIHHLLSGFVPCVLAGNIGIPFFDVLDEITPETRIVCELSAHQLEHAHHAPHIGVLLNLYEEHLDHYRSFIDYQNAKVNIFSGGSQDDIYIYNESDERIRERLKERFSPSDKRFVSFLPCKDKEVPIAEILAHPHPLIGKHNENNLVAALMAAHASGIDYARLATRAASFKPLPHRLEYAGCFEGKYFFNDSISTVPQAAVAAVESIGALPYVKGVDCLILGGMDRGIDYTPLVRFLQQRTVKSVIFVGLAGRRIFEALQKEKTLPEEYLLSDDYPALVAWAKAHTRKGFACVLSPAAASYDMFRDFAHRGETFKALVKDKQ